MTLVSRARPSEQIPARYHCPHRLLERLGARINALINSNDDLGVCAVNVAEFYTGLPPDQLLVWDDFFGDLLYWPITLTAARQAGHDRHFYARRGQSISTADAVIAAVAREQRATLITNNVRHFPMPDIELLPLTPADEPR